MHCHNPTVEGVVVNMARKESQYQAKEEAVSDSVPREWWILILRGILMSQEEGTRRAKHKAMVRPALYSWQLSIKRRNGGVPYCLVKTVVGGRVVMQR